VYSWYFMTTERPIPRPTGTVEDILVLKRTTIHRYRESQPSINVPEQDTLPGLDSSDE
jgi:hypothetical protein